MFDPNEMEKSFKLMARMGAVIAVFITAMVSIADYLIGSH